MVLSRRSLTFLSMPDRKLELVSMIFGSAAVLRYVENPTGVFLPTSTVGSSLSFSFTVTLTNAGSSPPRNDSGRGPENMLVGSVQRHRRP